MLKKALSMAAAQGQRIYTITPATQNIALPNIRLDATSMSEIRAALASGKHVTTHTDLLTVPGFKGAGYVITDPDTGAGVYKISGGKNGGYLMGLILGLLITTLLAGVIISSGGAALVMLPAMMVGFAISLQALGFYLMLGSDAKPVDSLFDVIDKDCFFAGLIRGLTPLLLLTTPLGFGASQIASWLPTALGLGDVYFNLAGGRDSDCMRG